MNEFTIIQVIGISYFAMGVGAILNPLFYRKLIANFLETPSVIYLGGVMSLILGYFIANFDFNKYTDIVWLVKLFGSLVLIKGLLIMVLPKHYLYLAKTFNKNISLMAFEVIFVIILGFALIYIGFYS